MKIDISTATKIMLYPEFMICNKSETDIHYHERSLIRARSNDFMYQFNRDLVDHITFSVDGFTDSKPIEIKKIEGTFDIEMK